MAERFQIPCLPFYTEVYVFGVIEYAWLKKQGLSWFWVHSSTFCSSNFPFICVPKSRTKNLPSKRERNKTAAVPATAHFHWRVQLAF